MCYGTCPFEQIGGHPEQWGTCAKKPGQICPDMLELCACCGEPVEDPEYDECEKCREEAEELEELKTDLENTWEEFQSLQSEHQRLTGQRWVKPLRLGPKKKEAV